MTNDSKPQSRDHAPRKETYGRGSIWYDKGRHRVVVPRKGKSRHTVGYYKNPDEARRVLNAYNLQRIEFVDDRMTLRQWGEAYLEIIKRQKSIKSTTDTWNSIVCDAPFIDLPLIEITPVLCSDWAEKDLPNTRAKRSVLKDGKRTLTRLANPISRSYQAQALGLLKRSLDRAKDKGFIPSNPAATVELERDYGGSHDPRLEYLTADDLDLLLGCKTCALEKNTTIGDVEMLAECPHMPFEVRVPFQLATHQAPRQGELAAMDWSRVEWATHEWWIAKSWDTSPKNNEWRKQALQPRSYRMLLKWWEINGKPTRGFVFPSTKGRKPFGPRAQFVHALDDATERRLSPKEIVKRAAEVGLKIAPHHVDVIRSKRRAVLGGRNKMFARGYDWGFQDHPEKGRSRPGWWQRVGITHRVRFHDLRDTAATHLLSGTWSQDGTPWDIKRVSLFLGHKNVKVTEDRYAHLTSEAARKEVRGLESDRGPRLVQAKHSSQIALTEQDSRTLQVADLLGAPELGLEPRTTRLTGNRSTNKSDTLAHFRAMSELSHAYSAETVQLALRTLERAADGETFRSRDLTRFAAAALAEHPQGKHALAILDDSPHSLTHAIELAKSILESTKASVSLHAP